MEKEEAVAMTGADAVDTVPKMFARAVAARGAQVSLRQKHFGIWQSISWTHFGQTARESGMGLAALGIAPGECASVLSNTNREWIYADMGILGAGGVSNGIYPTDAPLQVEYLCADSGTVYLFVEDDEQLDKVLEVRARLPQLRKIIVFDMEGLRELNDTQVISLDMLRGIGREYDAAHLGDKLAIGIGYKVAAYREGQKPVPAHVQAAFWLARILVLNNIRRAIGVHRARLLITGAAPTSPDLIRWYMALGLEMVEVWGQTESGGISTSNPVGASKPGSIGKPLPQTEVKVSPEGELLVRSPSVFMGYLNQPEKTAETLRDGWLHTGDVGRMDNEGFFYITDRMKDIIITAGGKNITPSELENELKFSPYITDAVVVGDRRAYLTVIVMVDQENVEKYAQDHDIPFSNYASLTRAKEVQDLIWSEIDRVNKKFARVE